MHGPAMMLHYLIDDSANVGFSTYVLVTIAGTGVQSHLAYPQHKARKAGRAVSPEKLHFSVCKSDGNWSAEEMSALAEEVEDLLQQQQPVAINKTFICDDDVFFNYECNKVQVLGGRPEDKHSPIHTVTDILQHGLEDYGDLEMERTIHTTILDRKGKRKDLAASSATPLSAITPLPSTNTTDWAH